MQDFKRICPYDFHEMLDKSDMSNDEVKDSLVYEVFKPTRNSNRNLDFTAFLSDISEALRGLDSSDDYKSYIEFFSGYQESVDEEYEELWYREDAMFEGRCLLYPKDSEGNRFVDKEKSELSVIVECLKILGKSTKYSIADCGTKYGKFSFSITKGKTVVFIIRPCCPVCTTLLPDFWFGDEIADYIPIALIGPSAGGKTTYMTSLMHGTFYDLLRDMGSPFEFTINNAIADEKQCVKIQAPRYDNLDLLNKNQFPNPTNLNKYPPVMFRIKRTFGSENVIVSIFDSAGEIFQKDDLSIDDLEFLKNMHAFIYFMEAAQIKNDKFAFKFCQDKEFEGICAPFEQGKFQKDNKDKNINKSAETIINENIKGKPNAFEMLLKIMGVVLGGAGITRFDCKHISFTIIKCDELEKISDDLDDDFLACMRKPISMVTSLNRNVIRGVTGIVENFINEMFFDDPDLKVDTCKKLKVTYSCHCASVAKDEKNNRRCQYDPIRIADPFVACLIDKFEELGWDKNNDDEG